MAAPGEGLGFLSKLKALGNKLESVATDVASGVASGVATGVNTVGTGVVAVGTGVVAVARDLKDTLLDSELDRIRAVNEFAKQNNVVKRKQLSEFELDAAESKADVVLGKLFAGYFDEGFDPVRHELSQLTDQDAQDNIDEIVERLSQGVETVSGKLSRHVVKKRDQLLDGINTVARVEGDLKAVLADTQAARTTLMQASQEVEQHLRVTSQTRRKKQYLQLMELCSRIKQVRDLQKALRAAQDNGEYAEAILLCVQCFQSMEPMRDLQVSAELLATVQRLYVDTLQKLNGALTAICGSFYPLRYSKVLEGYMLQNVSGATLADRVLQCFKDQIFDATIRVVKSTLLTSPKIISRLGSSASLEGSYVSLVAALPADLLAPCLCQLMEVCWDSLASYRSMAQWHVEAVQQASAVAQGAGPDSDAVETGPEAQQQRAAAATSLVYLQAVSDMLASHSAEVFQVAATRVFEVLNCPSAAKPDVLQRVAELCSRFMSVGEAFTGTSVVPVRIMMAGRLAMAFETWHHDMMQGLSALLQVENWRNISTHDTQAAVATGSVLALAQCIAETQPYTAGWVAPPPISEFSQQVSAGNPFTQLAAVAAAAADAQAAAAESASAAASTQQMVCPVLTRSGLHMLQYIKACGQLLRPLGPSMAGAVWQALTQMFDRYLLATFLVLSGLSVEALVLQDEAVTLRLRNALLRILTAEGSRYKAQVEELQRQRGQQAGLRPSASSQSASATGISWLDRFGDKMESLASDLETSVNKLSAKVPMVMPEGSLSAGAGGIGLMERMVAAEAMLTVSQEFAAARLAMVAALQAAVKVALGQPINGGRQRAGPAVGPAAPAAAGPFAPGPSPASFSGGSRLQYEGMPPQTPGPGPSPGPRLQHDGMAQAAQPAQPAGPRLQYEGMQQVMQGSPGAALAPVQVQVQGSSMACVTEQLPREANQYFKRTVEAGRDVQLCLIKSGLQILLSALLNPDRGLAAAAAACPAYWGREPTTAHSSWVDQALGSMRVAGGMISNVAASLPKQVEVQMWSCALELLADTMTHGFARAKKCTLEGRASMSLDLGHIEKGLRALVPAAASSSMQALQHTDQFVRAYYLPWEEFSRWAQLHLTEYLSGNDMLLLVEQVCDVHKISRKQRAELLDMLHRMAADLKLMG